MELGGGTVEGGRNGRRERGGEDVQRAGVGSKDWGRSGEDGGEQRGRAGMRGVGRKHGARRGE